MKNYLIILSVGFLFSCYTDTTQEQSPDINTATTEEQSADVNTASNQEIKNNLNEDGKTVETRFKTPNGYQRIEASTQSFGYYLRNLSLKPKGAKVKTYDGYEKPSDGVYCAVIDMEIGNRDLQQCADAVMRLRAEYLYKQQEYNQIHFNFTNGFRVDYEKWREGNRIAVNGNNTNWVHNSQVDTSYKSFRKYMDWIFMYAGSLSLSRELKAVDMMDMQIGDVLIHGGSPGHAVIVIDMAENKETGKKIFMIAQSYMPAQDIQVLTNNDNINFSPWYSLVDNEDIYTPEYDFKYNELMRF